MVTLLLAALFRKSFMQLSLQPLLNSCAQVLIICFRAGLPKIFAEQAALYFSTDCTIRLLIKCLEYFYLKKCTLSFVLS